MARRPQNTRTVGTLTHEEARRKNIPTAEYQSVMQKEEQNSVRVAYEHRNRDLDPQLVWRGKDAQDWSDLVVHAQWWQAHIARQQEIDASIAARAGFEYLYDWPYDDRRRVRVAGPFTVDSLSPHRVLGVDENDELIDSIAESADGYSAGQSFVQIILEHLKTAGVQQAHKDDKITFTALTPWPGDLVCAEGRYSEGNPESGSEKRAAIFIGPEFGTVSRPDLVSAAREAGDADFDVLIACAFNYDAHSSEFARLGRIPILKARMNADLHMADDLKTPVRATSSSSSASRTSISSRRRVARCRCRSTASMSFTPTPARCVATAPRALPAGSSTPTTTKRASSSARPISWAPTIPIERSRPPSRPKSTQTPGPRSIATCPDPSTNPGQGALRSRSSTTWVMK
jgi:hypothetical protein